MNLNALQSGHECRVLLVGEFDSGKSTLVNALPNYLKFATLQQTLYVPSELIHLVECGSYVAHLTPTERRRVRTRTTTEYSVRSGAAVLTLVDTPGLGRAPDTDQHTIADILRHLAAQSTRQLNAVLVVFRTDSPDNHRVRFLYSLSKLLTSLHRNMAHNIVLCPTIEATNHRLPVETSAARLHALLASEADKLGTVFDRTIRLGGNCFPMDTQAYCFLIRSRTIAERYNVQYGHGWTVALQQAQLLVNRLGQLKPVSLEFTFRLYDARRLFVLRLPVLRRIEQARLKAMDAIEKARAKIDNRGLNSDSIVAKQTSSASHLETAMKKIKFPFAKFNKPLSETEKKQVEQLILEKEAEVGQLDAKRTKEEVLCAKLASIIRTESILTYNRFQDAYIADHRQSHPLWSPFGNEQKEHTKMVQTLNHFMDVSTTKPNFAITDLAELVDQCRSTADTSNGDSKATNDSVGQMLFEGRVKLDDQRPSIVVDAGSGHQALSVPVSPQPPVDFDQIAQTVTRIEKQIEKQQQQQQPPYMYPASGGLDGEDPVLFQLKTALQLLVENQELLVDIKGDIDQSKTEGDRTPKANTVFDIKDSSLNNVVFSMGESSLGQMTMTMIEQQCPNLRLEDIDQLIKTHWTQVLPIIQGTPVRYPRVGPARPIRAMLPKPVAVLEEQEQPIIVPDAPGFHNVSIDVTVTEEDFQRLKNGKSLSELIVGHSTSPDPNMDLVGNINAEEVAKRSPEAQSNYGDTVEPIQTNGEVVQRAEVINVTKEPVIEEIIVTDQESARMMVDECRLTETEVNTIEPTKELTKSVVSNVDTNVAVKCPDQRNPTPAPRKVHFEHESNIFDNDKEDDARQWILQKDEFSSELFQWFESRMENLELEPSTADDVANNVLNQEEIQVKLPSSLFQNKRNAFVEVVDSREDEELVNPDPTNGTLPESIQSADENTWPIDPPQYSELTAHNESNSLVEHIDNNDSSSEAESSSNEGSVSFELSLDSEHESTETCTNQNEHERNSPEVRHQQSTSRFYC